MNAVSQRGFCLLVVLLLWFDDAAAQNLVPNCSFEDTVACPEFISQIHYATGWNGFGDSPDYFNACYDLPFYGVDVPVNLFGFQYAATGQAYSNIASYVNNPNNPLPGREWIGRELSGPLQIGQQYFISFKTSFACYGCSNNSRYATDKIGVLFTTATSHYPHEIPPVNNFAHLYTDSIITDTLNWVTVSGWITADSAYQYIILGNFFDNAHTDTIEFSSALLNWSYYYIDDVCVSIDSTKCSCESPHTCTDSNACTADTFINGQCTFLPIVCNDSNICTKDICDSLSGCAHSTLDCNDHNVCTTDTCDSILECIHTSINCDDNDSCTIDHCDSLHGCLHDILTGCVNGLPSYQIQPLSIYPNPASGLIRIRTSAPSTVLTIYDVIGRQMYHAITEQKEISINVSAFPNGVYFLRAQTKETFRAVKFSIRR